MRDDLEATVLRLEFEPGRVEWVAFNPEEKSLRVGAVETAEALTYQPGSRP